MTEFNSLYRAYCFDNKDPLGMGRVRAQCPAIYGEEYITDWCRSFGGVAGKNYGFVQLPEKGEGIYIAFEDGDTDYPIWTHGWFGKDEVPNEVVNNGDKIAIWRTKGGQTILLNDVNNSVEITTQKGGKISIVGEEIAIEGQSIKLLNGGQSAVLGNELESLFQKLLDTLISANVSGVPLSSVGQLTAMKLEVNKILSQKIKLK